jgi:hypothetical protein
MLSKSIVFEGFDFRSWGNLVSLFTPDSCPPDHAAREVVRDAMVGTLVVFVDDAARMLGAFHTERGRVGRLDPSLVHDTVPVDAPTLRALASAHHAARCVVIRDGAADEIAARISARITARDDYATQLLAVWQTVAEFRSAGLLHVWPERFLAVPTPRPVMLRRALDLVLPDDRSVLLAAWDEGELWTAVALRRRRGEIDAVQGPESILRWSGPLGGDWTRDHRILVHATSERFAPVELGLFCEARTLSRLMRQGEAGVWIRAVASRDVIVSPMPRTIGVALAADAVRALTRWASEVAGDIDALGALGVFAPVVGRLRGRVPTLASVSQTLGFDPIKTLAKSATSLRRSSLLPPSGR